jgi:hypothetical protein
VGTDSATQGRNHLIWLGPLVTFVGAVSYFLVFARFAALRDFPWVNLPLVLIGAAISVAGLRFALARSRGKILAAIGATLSIALTVLFCGYVFVLSYTLPDPSAETLALDQAPGFELQDENGDLVSLADLRGTRVILVFYRGFW